MRKVWKITRCRGLHLEKNFSKSSSVYTRTGGFFVYFGAWAFVAIEIPRALRNWFTLMNFVFAVRRDFVGLCS